MWGQVGFLATSFFLLGLIMWVANVAEQRRQQGQPYQGLALVSYLTLIVFFGFAVVIGLALQGMDVLLRTQPQLLDNAGVNLSDAPIESLAVLGLGLWLPSLIGVILLLPPVRRLAARLIPIDPQSPVHAAALALMALVGVNLLTTLGMGLGNLAESMEQQGLGEDSGVSLATLWGQQVFTAIFAMVGVGWLSRRTLPETMARLALVIPSLRQVLLGVGVALLLIPTALLVAALGEFAGVGADADVERLAEQLMGPLFRSPLGIISIGVAAALGEETLLRGAVQPRFGLLLTTILFALLHSNYGVSISTVIVFVAGLALGILRMRTNTTTAMIAHAVYNSTLGLLVYLGVSMT